MKKFLFLITVMAVFFSGCLDINDKNSDSQQATKMEKMMKEANAQVGMPNITNFAMKKNMKMIQEECDKTNSICYAYIQSEYTGKLVYIGKCIGYPIPYSAQFTNPEKLTEYLGSGGCVILPQADPNGLFMPPSADATWLMMVDPKTNEPRPVYMEPKVTVSPFPLTTDVS